MTKKIFPFRPDDDVKDTLNKLSKKLNLSKNKIINNQFKNKKKFEEILNE